MDNTSTLMDFSSFDDDDCENNEDCENDKNGLRLLDELFQKFDAQESTNFFYIGKKVFSFRSVQKP